MENSEGSVFAPGVKLSPWWWEWAPRETHNPPPLPADSEVAIIGSGFTGLSAALSLARAGKQVAVFESGAPGEGASSRNGGQVGSGNQRFTVAALRDAFGEKQAKALLNEGVQALAYLATLIDREGLQCHFERVGRYRGANHAKHLTPMLRDHEALSKLTGVEFFEVPKARQYDEIATDYYHGGVVLPGDASLHPALYHRELLRVVRAAGVKLVPFTPVIRIDRERQRVVLTTKRGEVSAGDVVIATNGYSGGVTPDFQNRVMPVGSAIIATQPLGIDTARRLIPKARVIGETRKVFYYYRLCPEKTRVLFGGRLAAPSSDARPEDFAHLHKGMCDIFPELRGVKVTHCWRGFTGYTKDTFPHMGKRDGLFYALGYCGSGVARATYLGHRIAQKIMGEVEGRTAWDELVFERFLFPAATRKLMPLAIGWYRLLDRFSA